MHDGSTVLSATHPSSALDDRSAARLRHAIEHATHYLPSQGPIAVFVHHNTLHAFEDLPFDDAVVVGGSMYDCQPYLSETKYRDALRVGRISLSDLRDVLMEDLGDDADELVSTFGTRYTLRLAMMQMPPHASVPDAELDWLLAESDLLRRFNDELPPSRRDHVINQTKAWAMRQQATAGAQKDWQSFTLNQLWNVCQRGVEVAGLAPPIEPTPLRHRDVMLAATGEDIDHVVDEVLIRFCGVFLDQGFAGLSLPDREAGFARSFAALYSQPMSMMPAWMRPLRGELLKLTSGDFDPLASIAESLELLSVDESSHDEYVGETLLALRGWAGMVWQMETTAPFLPKPTPAGSLAEYLAVRLLLERAALIDAGRRRYRTTDLDAIVARAIAETRGSRSPSIRQRTYTVFQLAQTGGWLPENLMTMTQPQWKRLIGEIESFTPLDRRRIFHTAYERRYRNDALDAISIHCQNTRDAIVAKRNRKTPPAFIAVFCIDDREESMRRHLEEVDPDCETASAAGFYAVAMNYQGADHAHYRPLCPNVITPTHYVREEPLFSSAKVSETRAKRRRRIGTLTHTVHASSRTMIGGWVTGIFGAVATFPLVARIMAPRLTSQIREAVGSIVRPPATELHLERITEQPGQDFDALGYSLPEMAGIVVRILQDIGLVENFPPVVVFFGHGSSSLNNPHESAYNCGACSGGRGGPNARAFAWMANDARVRSLVTEKGITLADDVRFVGAYHNTCNDAVEYYDLDSLPRSHRPLFRRIEASVDQARARNAHERARRFESAPLDLTVDAALQHVEQRAEDLSQARPEYNHATNAMVCVGRRDWTRGLFMDRRSFVVSYDPAIDDDSAAILARILAAAIPVCAGISLEYYFSTVDNEGYGCGSKLPHNIASMVGVMTGASSDLRPGLSQQMVEIHEPMRILFVIETTPKKMQGIIDGNPNIHRLVTGNWVQLAVIDPDTGDVRRYENGTFVNYHPTATSIPSVASSIDWYRGQRSHLGFAAIESAMESATGSAMDSSEAQA